MEKPIVGASERDFMIKLMELDKDNFKGFLGAFLQMYEEYDWDNLEKELGAELDLELKAKFLIDAFLHGAKEFNQ